MLKLKPGARITGLRNEVLLAITVAYSVYSENGYEMIITAGTDGSHSRGSEHYKGDAFDLRTRHLIAGDAAKIHSQLQDALGPEFDVVLEDTHIHIEFDPKVGINQ
jgi:hypothetical protein